MAVFRFRVSGQVFEFDDDPALLMGSELELIEERVGDLLDWGRRISDGPLKYRDILVVTYLAARRAGDTRPWSEFIATIAPLTFQIVEDETPPHVRAEVPAPPADAIPPDLAAKVADLIRAQGGAASL